MAAAESQAVKKKPEVREDPEMAKLREEVKEKLADDIFSGLLTRGAAAIAFAFLLGLLAFAALTKIPGLIENLLNRFLG